MINLLDVFQALSLEKNHLEKRMEDMLKAERELLILEVKEAVRKKMAMMPNPYDDLLK